MLSMFQDTLFDLYKSFYDSGVYTKSNIAYFVQIGTLSTAGYEKIVGESYANTTTQAQ